MTVPHSVSPSALQLRLLGGLQLSWQGQPLPLTARRLLGVLAFLHLNGTTPRSELGEMFWPGQGAAAVRQGLYTLRNLAGASVWLVNGAEVSLHAESDVQQVYTLLRGEQAQDALDVLQAGGPLLGHLSIPEAPDFMEWLEEQRAALQAAEQAALKRESRAARDRQDYPQARTYYQRLLALDPLSEATYRDLMHLEHAAGQSEAALDVFETLRRTLHTELQAEPEAETLALLRELEGHEISGQTRASLLSSPQVQEPLCGRESERQSAEQHLTRKGRALIQGMAGMGKTRLAWAIADAYLARGQGVLWLELGDESADILLPALTEPLGLRTLPARQQGSLLAKAFQEKNVGLIVLDNAANSYALSVLLEYLPPEAPVLVTSRLRLPRLPTLALHRLPRPDSLALVRTHLSGENTDPYTLDALCAVLGDHPYALRLAAMTMQKNGQSARELLQILSEAPHTLGDEQSVHTLLAQSTSALNAESYEAYLALGSLFTPQTTPELLALALRRDPDATERALYALVEHGLTTREAREGSEQVSFRMHELTWHDAKAHAALQPRTVLQAVSEYARANTPTPDALYAEVPNLIAAAQYAEKHNPAELVKVMSGWLGGQYIAARGFPVGYIDLLKQAEAYAVSTQDWPTASLLSGKLGDIQQGLLGNGEAAIFWYLQGATWAKQAGLLVKQATLLTLGGFLQARLKRPDAEHTLALAQVAAEQSGDIVCQARVLEQQGMHAAMQLDFARSYQLLSSARQRLRPLLDAQGPGSNGSLAAYGNMTSNLGQACLRLGHMDEALALKQESLDIALQMNEQLRIARAQVEVGEVLAAIGQVAEARTALEQAVAGFKAAGAIAMANAAAQQIGALPAL